MVLGGILCDILRKQTLEQTMPHHIAAADAAVAKERQHGGGGRFRRSIQWLANEFQAERHNFFFCTDLWSDGRVGRNIDGAGERRTPNSTMSVGYNGGAGLSNLAAQPLGVRRRHAPKKKDPSCCGCRDRRRAMSEAAVVLAQHGREPEAGHALPQARRVVRRGEAA